MLKTMKIGLRTGFCCALSSGWLTIAYPAIEAAPQDEAPSAMLPTAGNTSRLALPETSNKSIASDLDYLLLLLTIITALGTVVFLSLFLLRRQRDTPSHQIWDMPVDRNAESDSDAPRLLAQNSQEQFYEQATRRRTSTAPLNSTPHEIAPSWECAQPPHEDAPSQPDLLTLSAALQVARGEKNSGGIAADIRLFAECAQHLQELAEENGQDKILPACVGESHARSLIRRQDARYLIFSLGGERLAVNTLTVKDILAPGPLNFEQDMSPSIHALTELHGARVPLIDLGRNAGGGQTRIDGDSRIVLLEVSHDERRLPLGVLVDTVHEIATVVSLHSAPPADLPGLVRSDFIQGQGQVEGLLVTLLDIDKGLSPGELANIAALTQLAPQGETPA